MTFIDDEKSVESSNPVELYEFIGTITTYYRTSGASNYDYGGNTYIAVPMDRNQIPTEVSQEDPLDVTLRISDQLIQDYAFGITPSSLTVVVRRIHQSSSNVQPIWAGSLKSIKVRGRDCVLAFHNPLSKGLKQPLPQAGVQVQCNHILYDTRCTVLSTSFDAITTVAGGGISADGLEITVASDGGNPDGWSVGGMLTHVSSGESRLVLGHVGNVITVQWPFPSIAVSDAVTLFAGCNHTLGDCHAKFNNRANFGAFAHIPESSVFKVGWDG